MSSIIEFLESHLSQQMALLIISALPLVELKGAIPIGHALGLSTVKTYFISYIGSLLPVPFILLFIRKIFEIMRKNKKLSKIVDRILNKANRKAKDMDKKSYLALFIFVSIPLPSTGVWMGSLLATIFGLNRLYAFLVIAAGNSVAALIMSLLSHIFIKG